MKTILISGAYSGCGKTTTAAFLSEILKNNFCVKLGEGKSKTDNPVLLLEKDVSYDTFIKNIPENVKYLLVESNNFKLFPVIDLHIFIDGDKIKYKASAEKTKKNADLVSNTDIDCCLALSKAKQLEINPRMFGKILDFLKIKVRKCQLGLFDK